MVNNDLSLLEVAGARLGKSDEQHEIQRLEDEVRSLRRQLEDVDRERDRMAQSMENLRKTLGPIHRALRILFGEIEISIGEEQPTRLQQPPDSAGGDPRWEHFKKQFPGVPAAMIDTLLIHGEVGMTNLAALMKRAYGTTKNAAYKLSSAGAVSINRGVVSLKR